MHDISIKKVNRGFVVTVGCQTFVFEHDKDMFQAMRDYWKDPEAAEKKYVTDKPKFQIGLSFSLPNMKALGAALKSTAEKEKEHSKGIAQEFARRP
jgi:hypothetical protein